MSYTPLSDRRHQPLGSTPRPRTGADDDVSELPEGVFFSGKRTDDRPDRPAGLYYKDGTGNVRRVRLSADGRFAFAPVSAEARFVAIGDVLFVPEVDPRSWSAAREAATKRLPELKALQPGGFFTALGSSENPASQRYGIYRLGRDRVFRRLLKDQPKGLHWSSAIPADRFGYFDQALDVETE
jgi:hypothetical protein